MVAQPSVKICGESYFETAWIMLRLKLNKIEPTFIRRELYHFGATLGSGCKRGQVRFLPLRSPSSILRTLRVSCPSSVTLVFIRK